MVLKFYNEKEVVVVGGGVAGVAAAVSAARCGVETLLIERYGFLGGTATASSVRVFMNFYLKSKPLVGGIMLEVIERLEGLGGYDRRSKVFDPELMKVVLEDMALESGVKLLYHTEFIDVVMQGNVLRGVVIHNKAGTQLVMSKVVVDATGDGDVAVAAGCPYKMGRDVDGLTQPMTLIFELANVKEEFMPSNDVLNSEFERVKRSGKLDIPRENVLWFKTPYKGLIFFNTTRIVRVNGTDPDDLTKAEIEGRRQMLSFVSWLKKTFPKAFGDSYIAKSGPQIGVRETRRIVGEYVLTEDDVLSAKKFPDTVCRANYPIDIHNPLGEGTVIKHPPRGDYYEIPYRCLVPKSVENLLVTGRCISATHEALAAIRIMPTCIGLGQAAGVAAALSVKLGVRPRYLSVELLRETLKEQGAIL